MDALFVLKLWIWESACPPYHLAFVIGGTSAEANLAAVKKASAGYFDNFPTVTWQVRPFVI
jgi:fumarate hydratase class I